MVNIWTRQGLFPFDAINISFSLYAFMFKTRLFEDKASVTRNTITPTTNTGCLMSSSETSSLSWATLLS